MHRELETVQKNFRAWIQDATLPEIRELLVIIGDEVERRGVNAKSYLVDAAWAVLDHVTAYRQGREAR